MKISAIQRNTGSEKALNLTQACDLVAQAVAQDGRIWWSCRGVCLHGGLGRRETCAAEELPVAGQIGGAAYESLREMARSHGVFVHGGSFVERDGDAYYNTTLAFDRTGAELARYRKIHLFDVTTPDGRSYRESDTFGAGQAVVTYRADAATIGCSICYDLRFAELFRALAEAGADVIMVPAAFTLQTGKDHWEVLLRARAIETQTYIVAAAQTGSYFEGSDERVSWGHSMIVNPWGHLIAQAGEGIGHASAALDLDYLSTVRARIPVARHRVL